MCNGARVRIVGAAWNVVEAHGKWHSPLVVSKDSKYVGKKRERWLVEEERRARGGWRISPENPGPIFKNYILKKRKSIFQTVQNNLGSKDLT